MSTKDYRLSLKNKQEIVNNDFLNERYGNLNLNSSFCSVISLVKVKSISKDSKKVSKFDSNEKFNVPQSSISWKKSNLKLFSKNANVVQFNFDKTKEFKEEIDSSPANNSTLSLHIAAYENSDESTSDNSFNGSYDEIKAKIVTTKKWKNLKQILFGGGPFIQNSFEFPRQFEDEKVKEPEIVQFKASQKLLNPNESIIASSQSKTFICDPNGCITVAECHEQEMITPQPSQKDVNMSLDESFMDVDASLESAALSMNECEKCQDLAMQIDIFEEKITELEEMCENQKSYVERKKQLIEEEKLEIEIRNDECQQLQNELDAYLTTSGTELIEKLPTFAQARIYELSNGINHYKNETKNIQFECAKKYVEYQQETDRFNSLCIEYNSVKAKVQQQNEGHEDIKKKFLEFILTFNSNIQQKSGQIQNLQEIISTSSKLFGKILGAPEFGNDELKLEIQQFLETSLNSSKN